MGLRIGRGTVLPGEVPGRTAGLEREVGVGGTVVGSVVLEPGPVDRGSVQSMMPLCRG